MNELAQQIMDVRTEAECADTHAEYLALMEKYKALRKQWEEFCGKKALIAVDIGKVNEMRKMMRREL